MNWREKSTPGEVVVNEVHDLLRIDDTWLVSRPEGFSYWASDLCTTVKTDMGVFRGSQSVYKAEAETDLIKGRGHLRELVVALEHEMDGCSFSCPVYDQAGDVFRLYCAVYATSDDVGWLAKTFAAAVALQIAEASAMAQAFQRSFHAVPATTGHPTAGLRGAPDAMLTHAEALFHPSGDHPSRWIGDPGWQRAGWVMEREARKFETDNLGVLEAAFHWPCGEGQIDLAVRTDEPHAKLGNGLHATLTIPLRLNAEAIGHLALDLNSAERADYRRCHLLGSWCGHDGSLAFRMFLPNALHHPSSLEETCVNLATRAIWAAEYFEARQREAQEARAGG